MKIERISDNQIRCTLNKEDLAGKETLLNELAFGSDKAKGLFRELMKKASAELGFETNDIPLMVEAIPVSKDCLILVITRVDDPEDFHEHYKKLAKNIPTEHLSFSGDHDLPELADLFGDLSKSGNPEMEKHMKHALADTSVGIYCFGSLEDVADAAKLLKDYTVQSTLYKDTENRCYYLFLTSLDESPDSDMMDDIHRILSEYCKRLPNTYATKALFNEHLKTIIQTQAIEEMASY